MKIFPLPIHQGLLPMVIALGLSACSSLPELSLPKTEPAVTPSTTESSDASGEQAPLPALETPRGLTPLSRNLAQSNTMVAPAQPSADLWDRIRVGFAMPELADKRVDKYIKFYVDRPEYMQRMTERSEKYLYYIVEALHERNMPMELALLPFIESAFNPEALSRAKAAGMWQFIPSTGRHFKLTQNVLLDERRDVLESTKAALDYLQSLHEMFGDWQLALAAYNWGEGNVQKAIKRNKRLKRSTQYSSLRMPRETRNYVPKLMAMRALVANPDQYKISLPTVSNHPFFDVVRITQDIDVSLVAKLAGVSEDEFRALNPSLKHPVILAAGLPRILLPWENAGFFASNLEQYDKPLASWTAWRVPQTANPATLAKLIGVSESELREVNGIPNGRVVTKGSVLVVRRTDAIDRDAPDTITDRANLDLRFEYGVAGTVRVGRGDSLSRIAKRHGVSTKQLADANGISTRDIIRIGQRLRIPGRARTSQVVAGPEEVRVRSGDSLSRIASRHGVSTRLLAEVNGLTLKSMIRVGQVLRIPGRDGSVRSQVNTVPADTSSAKASSSYEASDTLVRVGRGDSLSRIAKRHGVPTSALAAVNGLSLRSTIRVGQSLRLPQGSNTQAPSTQAEPRPNIASSANTAGTIRVRQGDSLYTIAKRHGLSIADLTKANGISRRSTLQIGQELRLPSKAIDTPSSATPTTRENVSASGQSETGLARVRRGDTLSGIAKRHQVSTVALARANGLSLKSTLQIGQALVLPSGTYPRASDESTTRPSMVRVRRGDSLYVIAKRHGVSIAALAQANGINRRSTLQIGQQLTIPK